MKKIVCFIAAFALFMPLFSSVVFLEDIPDDVRNRLSHAVTEAIGDRNETEVRVENFSLEDDLLSCTFSYCGKSVGIHTPLEYLEDEVKALFYYDDTLFEEGERLDYIYRTSFSSVSLDNPRRGQHYALIGESGKTQALFVVDFIYDEAAVLKPYYLASPLPGMKMKKINSFSLSLRALSSFRFSEFGASVSLFLPSFCYPLSPFVQAAAFRSGKLTYHLLAGFSSSFAFASFWPDVPVIKNLSLEAEFALGASYSSGFALSSEYGVALKWTPERIFSLSLGIAGYGGSVYLALAAGGKL